MRSEDSKHLLQGFWVTALGTLLSRVLGLVRDIATVSLFGLGGGALDALVVALRIPNLFRRLFGEGALAACYLPVLAQQAERGQQQAWQFVSAFLARLAFVLLATVAFAEIACGVALWLVPAGEPSRLLVQLLTLLLPYLIVVCLSAQLATTLQWQNRFTVAAAAPALLNVCWLVAVLWICPRIASPADQAMAVAVSVLVSGLLQALVQLPTLYRLGFRFQRSDESAKPALRQVSMSLVPMLAGLAVTQFNTLLDSLLAWGLAAPAAGSHAISWLGGIANYPLQPGAVSAIYLGERMYQLPIGLLGIAIATVVFPRFSRHGAASDHSRLGSELTSVLRAVWFLTIPASVGLVLLASPLAKVLFERGEFTAADTSRAATIIVGYASAVWAYSALPVIVRAFYALSDQVSPARIAAKVVFVNVVLDVTLIWPLGELGLAISTAVAAVLQVALLLQAFNGSHVSIRWRELGTTSLKTGVLAGLMAVVVVATIQPAAGRGAQALSLVTSITVGLLAFLTGAAVLKMPELRQFVPHLPRFDGPRFRRLL